MSQKLVLIDGHSILNRAFYGVPDLSNAEGLHTNAIYGFLNIMFKILEEEKPEYLAVAFDVHAPTFRHQMYEAYKGTRKPMLPELKQSLPDPDILFDLVSDHFSTSYNNLNGKHLQYGIILLHLKCFPEKSVSFESAGIARWNQVTCFL